MKKIIALFSIFILIFGSAYAGQTVNIYATVGSVNQAPRFVSVTPSNATILVGSGASKTISVGVSDPELDTIYYSITTNGGTASPINGTLAGSGYINFTYLAPATKYVYYTITVTLNDTNNIVTKDLTILTY